MNWYGLALLVHILGAVVLVGTSFIAPSLTTGLRRQATVESLRPLAELTHKLVKFAMPASLVTLAAGLYMAFTAWSWEGWIVVSLAIFLGQGVAAGTVIEPAVTRLRDTAATTDDGPVTVELGEILRAPALVVVDPVFLALDIAIVFMMTNKPGWGGALLAAGSALAVGGLFAAHALRTHRVIAPAAAA